MLPSAPASSISTSRTGLLPANGVAYIVRVALASWRTMIAERLLQGGFVGYVAIWVVRPIFELTLAAQIYGRGRPDLLRYATVALAANMAVSNTIYFVGEILDRERVKGTLVGLFLAPCARFSWLTGFALVGVVETALAAAVALVFGRYAFGVRFDPDYPALALSLAFFLASLWGMGLAFSAIGLYLKKANPFSNVVSPFTVLLGGAYYPVALLPAWLRYPARALPLGYGMQALADATLYHAGIRDLASQLLPLAGFALVLPVAGVAAFAWVERLVRERGELDLY